MQRWQIKCQHVGSMNGGFVAQLEYGDGTLHAE